MAQRQANTKDRINFPKGQEITVTLNDHPGCSEPGAKFTGNFDGVVAEPSIHPMVLDETNGFHWKLVLHVPFERQPLGIHLALIDSIDVGLNKPDLHLPGLDSDPEPQVDAPDDPEPEGDQQ